MGDAPLPRGRAGPLASLLGRTTWADRLLVLLLLAGSVASAAMLPAKRRGAAAVVEVDGAVAARLPLDRDTTFAAAGPLGPTRVAVAGGSVLIAESPCRNRICVALGPAREEGEVRACVPNRVVVRVTAPAGSEERGDRLDAVTR